MHIVQLLLPLADNEHHRFPSELYARVGRELTARFGGVTAYTRSPAEGVWAPDAADAGQGRDAGQGVSSADRPASRDDVVIFEVMADDLQRDWWADYRRELEVTFRQRELVVRAYEAERL